MDGFPFNKLSDWFFLAKLELKTVCVCVCIRLRSYLYFFVIKYITITP